MRFLTRIPVPGPDVPYATATPWFPLAGLLIGLLVGTVAAILSVLTTPLLAATLAVVTGMALTGAFHEDGLADTADAFGGGWTTEQRLEILGDPRHGTYGVAALCGSVVVRVAALAAVLGAGGAATGLVAAVVAHSLGRAGAVVVLSVVPSARPTKEGLALQSRRDLSRRAVVVSVCLCSLVAVVLLGWWALPVLVAVGGVAAVTARLALGKIGGVVGDVLGTIEQLSECAVLVVVALLAARTTLWWA